MVWCETLDQAGWVSGIHYGGASSISRRLFVPPHNPVIGPTVLPVKRVVCGLGNLTVGRAISDVGSACVRATCTCGRTCARAHTRTPSPARLRAHTTARTPLAPRDSCWVGGKSRAVMHTLKRPPSPLQQRPAGKPEAAYRLGSTWRYDRVTDALEPRAVRTDRFISPGRRRPTSSSALTLVILAIFGSRARRTTGPGCPRCPTYLALLPKIVNTL
jgi:hypothetical protein